jgi:hypothetical protein
VCCRRTGLDRGSQELQVELEIDGGRFCVALDGAGIINKLADLEVGVGRLEMKPARRNERVLGESSSSLGSP